MFQSGISKRVSDLLFGKKNDKSIIDDGRYVSEEDILIAFQEALNDNGEGSYIIDSKDEIANIHEILEKVALSAGKIIVKEGSQKVVNQDSRQWGIKAKESGTYKGAGLAFLGNHGIELPCGEYINETELAKALEEYEIKTALNPTEEPKIPIPESKEEKHSEKHSIVSITKNDKIRKTVSGLLIGLSLLSGFKATEIKDSIPIHDYISQTYSEEIDNLEFDIKEMPEISQELIEQAIQQKIDKLNTGDLIFVPDGTIAYKNSLETGGFEIYGENWKESGNVPITGVSVVKDGIILGAIENYTNDSSLQGINLQEYLKTVCTNKGISPDEVEMMVHTDVRGGWTNIKNLINEDTISKKDIESSVKALSSYSDIIDNFQGDTITIMTQDGEVAIKILDEEGNLLPDGTQVKGSDGKTYLLNDLNLFTTTEYIDTSDQIEDEGNVNYKLGYSLTNLNYALLASGIGLGIVLQGLQKKRNNFNKDNPLYEEFKTQEELDKFLDSVFLVESEKSKSSIREFLTRKFIIDEKGSVKTYSTEEITKMTEIAHSYIEFDRLSAKDGKLVGETGDKTIIVPSEAEHKIAGEIQGTEVANGTLSSDWIKKFESFFQKCPRGKINEVFSRLKMSLKDKTTKTKEDAERD